MAFMGETTEVGIADLLSVLARRGHTGRLTISADKDDTQIYLDGGKISLVSSSRRELRLGRVLVRLGTIDEVNLGAAVREQDQNGAGRALGQILTESGRLTTADLVHAAEEQCIEALARVIVAAKGSFMFNRDLRPSFSEGLLALNAEGIVLEASRRADEMMRLHGLLPPAGVRLALTPKAATEAPSLSVAETLVADALRRQPCSLEELAEELPIEEVALWRAIVRLRERVLIYAVAGQTALLAVPPSGPAPERTVTGVLQLAAAGRLSATTPLPVLSEIRAAGFASDAVAAGLVAAVRAFLLERNNRRMLAALGHCTDDFLRRRGMLAAAEIEMLRKEGPPVPPDDQERLLDLRDARLLDDGRASAIVITGRPNQPECRAIMIFAQEGHNWRIDADLG